MKKKKRVIRTIFVTEYKYLEKYLEKMAAKGWLLTEFKKFAMVFEQIEPTEYAFNVSFFYHTTPFDYPNVEKDRDYRELCEKSGWIFCAKNQIYQVFYKPKHKQIVPIHTDPREEYKMVKKTFMKTELIAALSLVLLLVMGIMKFLNFNYEDLLSNASIYVFIIPIIVTIYLLVFFVPTLTWLVKNKGRAQRGEALSQTGEIAVKLRHGIIIVLLCIMIVGSVVPWIELGNSGSFDIISVILMIAIPSGIGLLLLKNFKKKKRSRGANIAIYISVFILSWIICMGVFMHHILSSVGDYSDRQPTKTAEDITLTLSDFNVKGNLSRDYIKRKSSILVPSYLKHHESLAGRNENNPINSITTIYMECRNDAIARYMFDGYLERRIRYETNGLNKAGRELWESEKDYFYSVFSLEMSGKWQVDAGYTVKSNSVVLRKGNVVYIIEASLDFTDDEVINICGEKLGL